MASFGRGQSNQMRTKRKSRFHDADAGGLAAGPPMNIQAALGTLCQNPHLAGLINSGQGQNYGLHGAGQGQNFGLQGAGPGQNFGPQGMGPGQNFGPQGVGQRSKGLMSSAGGPSRYSDTASSSLPSLFGVRNQNQQSHAVQKQIDADRASNILAAFGLSSRDLDELSHYPEDKLTPESLPEILTEIKRRRANEGAASKYSRGDGSLRHDRSYRTSHDDWEEERHFRKRNYGSRDSSLDSVVEYSHGHSSRESSSRYDRKDYERERLRGTDDFSREEMHLSDPSHNFNKFDSDYGRAARLPSPRTHERSLFERKRGSPSLNNINDYHGFLPAVFPYLCSLCDLNIHSVQEWNQHKNSTTHIRLCDLLVEIYPEWNPDAFPPQMADPLVLQSTNLAPGAFNFVFGWNGNAALAFGILPPAIYLLICYKVKSDTQITIAAVMSIFYAFLMIATILSIVGEMVKENTIVTPTSLFFISMIILFVSTAMLHPQEFPLVIYGLLYIICIPSGYLLLPIYSMVNMNNVSWGTRETATPKKKKKKKPEQLLRYEKKWKCICWDIEFSVKEDKKEQTQYADRIVDEEDEMEPTVEDNWISNLQEQSLHIVLAEEELDEVEIPFWNDLINMYLKPIEEDKDRQTEIEKQLKSLRNKATFLFFIINVLWIVSTFILQAIGPDIHIKIPKLLSNGNYSETENLSIEPLGFFFLISFAGLLAIQFFAMLYHRY
ncbi:hypothetical protein scyTo_0008317 [Scyliorhinus torazame]|uniref:U1-type domain-containing protein n=1 Tax=Scyliorhinus torazame TaxID=75743 RepID=A0A401P787_SCYTO|nr:hypothetical protein [Scyliorhinus torazame]